MKKSMCKTSCAQCALISKVRRTKTRTAPRRGESDCPSTEAFLWACCMQNQYPDGKRFAEILDNLIFCLKTDLNNLSNSAEILIHLGSPSRTRTYDPRINSPLLYQLSYRGINKEFI